MAITPQAASAGSAPPEQRPSPHQAADEDRQEPEHEEHERRLHRLALDGRRRAVHDAEEGLEGAADQQESPTHPTTASGVCRIVAAAFENDRGHEQPAQHLRDGEQQVPGVTERGPDELGRDRHGEQQGSDGGTNNEGHGDLLDSDGSGQYLTLGAHRD